MLCSVRKCKFCSSVQTVQPWLTPIRRSIGMIQVAMCYRLLAGYLQMSQKRMIHITYGHCIGLCCRPWQRCQKAETLVHTLFGGSGCDSAVGWAALTRPSIACGAPNFYGGLKVLASLQVILGQFLHEEAGGWFPSLRLPAPDELLTMQEVSNPITQTSCLHSIDIAMITRWMPCALVWNPRRRIKAWGRSACLAVWP